MTPPPPPADDPPPPRGVADRLPGLLAGVLVGLVAGVVLGQLVRDPGAAAAGPDVTVTDVPAAEIGDRVVRTRDEFTRLVRGKTGPQVVAAVGRPNRILGDEASPRKLLYFGATRETSQAAADEAAVVLFQAGTAVGTLFTPPPPQPPDQAPR